MNSTDLEQCLDDIGDFIATLDRYPEATLARALSVHLGTLLKTMIDSDLCTRAQAQELIVDLERDTR